MKRRFLAVALAVGATTLTMAPGLSQTAPRSGSGTAPAAQADQAAQAAQTAPFQLAQAASPRPVVTPTPSAKPTARPAVSPTPKPVPTPKPTPPAPTGSDRVRIFSDRAIYKRQDKRAEAIGHVKIIQDNTTIYADRVLYNEATKQSNVDDGVKIVQVNKAKDRGRTTTITAGKMTAYHQERRMIFREDVRMDRDPATLPEPPEFAVSKAEKRARTERAVEKARSVITANQMEYFTRTEDANLEGKVVILQKDKQVTGDKAFVRGERSGDQIIVDGNAEVTQINGNWLVRNKIIKPDPGDIEQQRFLREKLVIKADKITIFRATDDLKAEGNVRITQKVGGKERVAVGKDATFSDKQQLATLTGDVKFLRENGDWMTSEKALFYTDKDIFEAIGRPDKQVEFEGELEDENSPKPKEPINAPLPDFNLDDHQPGERVPAWLRNGNEPARAPAQPPASPGTSSASPTPAPSPVPTPTPQPSPSPTPQSAVPQNRPAPVQSSFTIRTEN